jgi:hypothetical protein
MTRRLAALVTAVVCVTPAIVVAQSADNTLIMDHRLTLELVKSTVAVDRDLVAAMKKDPMLLKRGPKQTPGIDASAAEMEKLPELAAILKVNGITGRNYLLTMMSMMSTSMTHEFIASGKMPAPPAGMPTHNLEFWKSNAEALKPLEAEWRTLRGEMTAMLK